MPCTITWNKVYVVNNQSKNRGRNYRYNKFPTVTTHRWLQMLNKQWQLPQKMYSRRPVGRREEFNNARYDLCLVFCRIQKLSQLQQPRVVTLSAVQEQKIKENRWNVVRSENSRRLELCWEDSNVWIFNFVLYQVMVRQKLHDGRK